MFEAEKIKNFDDYKEKEPAFFTMSAYLINMFEGQDANKLVESINISHIKVVPQVMQGAKNCLLFQDNFTFRKITVCLKSEASVMQIEKAFQNFMKCRMGADLSEADPQIIKSILEASCSGTKNTKGVKYDLVKIKNTVAHYLKKEGFKVNEETTSGSGELGATNTETPGDANAPHHSKNFNIRVPGTLPPEEKRKRGGRIDDAMPDMY